MPAILMIPFVALLGKAFYQPAFSIFLGAVNVSLSYIVILKFFKDKRLSWWVSILYAFGTIHWYHAQVGSSWYIAHIAALLFLWLALLEIAARKRLFLIGLFIGGAYLARLPTILAVIFVPIFLKEKLLNFKNLFLLFSGLLPAVIFNALYNFLRFGKFSDYAYSLYLDSQSSVIKQTVFPHGFFSIYYLPDRIKDLFFSFPIVSDQFPYIIPSLYAMAIYVVTPAFLLTVFASFRQRLLYSSLFAVLIMAIPSLIKGGNGFTQFGFRYSLDFHPFLLILMASGFKNRFNTFSKVLVFLSIVINLWGIIMISFLNIWTFS